MPCGHPTELAPGPHASVLPGHQDPLDRGSLALLLQRKISGENTTCSQTPRWQKNHRFCSMSWSSCCLEYLYSFFSPLKLVSGLLNVCVLMCKTQFHLTLEKILGNKLESLFSVNNTGETCFQSDEKLKYSVDKYFKNSYT